MRPGWRRRPSHDAERFDPALSLRSGADVSAAWESVERLAGIDDRRILSQAIEVAPAAIFWKNDAGRFLGANQEFLDVLGVASVDDIIGRDDRDFFPPEQAEMFRSVDREVIESGRSAVEFEEILTRPDGVVEVLHTSKAALRDELGAVVGLVGGFRRVTSAVEIEAALLRSQELYSLVVQASRDGIWDWKASTDTIEMSPRCAELLGLPAAPITMSSAEAATCIEPEDEQRLAEVAAEVFQTGVSRISETVRVILPEGGTRWVEAVGAPLLRDGRVERIVGSLADVTDDIVRERELQHRASHDGLTGLANRWSLNERVEQVLEECQPASMLYLDLDQFKVINDSLGHQVGDEMLAAVAQRLRSIADDEASVLARVGGDEFAVLCVDVDHVRSEQLAGRLVREFTAPFEVAGLEMYSSVSVGIVHFSSAHRSAADVMRDADTCLYSAKAAGKSCFRVFEPQMRAEADRALLHQNRIRRAVDGMQFALHYQPICDARTGVMVGVEALIRWPGDDGEHLEPSAFLPFLEQTGLIVAVGEWVVATACRQLADWRAADVRARDLYVAVNISRVQFRSVRLVDAVVEAMAAAGVEPADLVIEVTETAVSRDLDSVSAQLVRLRELGIRVAIDDFGVGQSSLSTLDQLPADILKIDRAIVMRLEASDPAPVANAVISMAHALGLITVAEGVERAGQRAWLQEAGCDLLQGHFFSVPMPPDEVLDHLT